jgi:hypothetical protein
MPEWAAVETLIRDLGAVRSAAFVSRADGVAYAAIETAIAEATDAVIAVLGAPRDQQGIARAHEAIDVVAHVLANLDREVVRSLGIRVRAAELTGRAKELVEQARRARSVPRVR